MQSSNDNNSNSNSNGKKRKVEREDGDGQEHYTLVTILSFSWGNCESGGIEPQLRHYMVPDKIINGEMRKELEKYNGETRNVFTRDQDSPSFEKVFIHEHLEDLLHEDNGVATVKLSGQIVSHMYSINVFALDM